MDARHIVGTWDHDLAGVAAKLSFVAALLVGGAAAAPQVAGWLDGVVGDTTAPSAARQRASAPAVERTVTTVPEPSGPLARTVTTVPEPAGPLARTVTTVPDVAGPLARTVTTVPDPGGPLSAEGAEAATVVTAVSPFPAGVPAPRAADGTWGVLYVGDSLAYQTEAQLSSLLAADTVDRLTFGGTAPCDWVDKVAGHAAATAPDLVVVSFLGNNGTPCAGGATGSELLSAYERDLTAMCAAVAPARCVLVGQPTLLPDVGRTMPADDQPTSMYRSLAQAGAWGFVDAGAAVETDDGGFDPALRDPDQVHFNADGAARYATAIAGFVDDVRS